MPRTAVSLRIEGRVQGVGYRWWATGEARRLGLAGWVRNRRDGSVEALVIGSEAALKDFIDACHLGPAGAAVQDIIRRAGEDDGSAAFEQRPTE